MNVTHRHRRAPDGSSPGCTRTTSLVYEDGRPQVMSQFDAERVPVSLGIALDTSGSMAGRKIAAAQAALNRFLFDLLGPQDEVFLYRFDSRPTLVQRLDDGPRRRSAAGSERSSRAAARRCTTRWPTPSRSRSRARSRKKALVVISDGNDTSSRTSSPRLRQLFARPKCSSTPSASTRRADAVRPSAAADASWTVPSPAPVSRRARRAPRDRAGHRAARRSRCRRSRQRRGPARDHRRQRRTHRDHRLASRPRPGDGGDCRRVEPAVFPRLRVLPAQGRAVAHD